MDLAPAAARRSLTDKQPKEIVVNNEVYDVVNPNASGAVNAIMFVWEKTGRPEDPFSDAGEKVINTIIATWEDLFPADSRKWYAERAEYRKEELSTREQVHRKTGRSLASYPYYIFTILKKVFPSTKFADRETALKMVKRYPMFQLANKA